MGKYPKGDKTTCLFCDPGTYAPTAGMAACLNCPLGSVALSGSQTPTSISTLTEGATTCEPW